MPINKLETYLSASAKPPASTSAVVAELQARHATALRSYALELWDGNARRADESLAALWREWSKTPPAAADANAREVAFAALRRHVVAMQRSAGARPETEHESDTENESGNESATERVARRFRQLTPKQQEVLRLRLRHNFGADEIAHITELASTAVEQLIHHALGRLDGSPGDEPRLTRLALSRATAEETAAESPADRARIAELRLTAEVARQVLARGLETFVTKKRRRSRRRIFAIIGIAVVALVGFGFFLLRSRAPDREAASGSTEDIAATGTSHVSIARTEMKNDSAPSHAAFGEATNGDRGRGFTPRRSTHEAPAVAPTPTSGRKAPPITEASHTASATFAPTTTEPAPRSVDNRVSTSNTSATLPPSADSPAHRGIPTGEVGRAEPSAQPRGSSDAEKISGPLAQPLGHADPIAPASPHRSTATAPSGGRGFTPRHSGREAPTNSQNPPSARNTAQAAPTAPAASAIEPAPHASANAKPLAADQLDTAPIAALRKALGASRWPQPRQVNVRAFINAAPPLTPPPAPSAGEVLTARVESSESPLHPERRLVRVELRARETTPAPRAPATVILLLDVSGSMDAPNRLPLVQEAVAALLRRLHPEDRVGIVTYAGESRVLLPPEKLTDERAVRAAIDALEAKGRTNGGAGLREAFALAEADRRAASEHVVILCTDGNFNMGETTEAELGALIDGHRDRGVRLAIFGFGRPDRIDTRLEALAARARGGSGYVNTRAEAELALVSQLDALFAPVAEKLTATVEFDPARVARFRVLGEAEMHPTRTGATIPIATCERVLPGETLSTLFEIEPASSVAPATTSADFRVRATCLLASEPRESPRQSPYYGLWPARAGVQKFSEASVDFRFAAAMAAFGEALQAGPDAGAAQLDEIAQWARGAVGEDAGGYRAELVALLEKAQHAATR